MIEWNDGWWINRTLGQRTRRLFVKQRPSCNSLSLNPISPDVTAASSSLPHPLRVPRVSIIHGEPTAAHWIDLRALYTGSRVENSAGSITEQVVTTMLGHSYLVISIYADERWALVHHEGTDTDSKCLIFETILFLFHFSSSNEITRIYLSIIVNRILKWFVIVRIYKYGNNFYNWFKITDRWMKIWEEVSSLFLRWISMFVNFSQITDTHKERIRGDITKPNLTCFICPTN